LNMWTVNFSNSNLLGYAQFPSASGLPGLNSDGGAATTDGVVSGYNYFGSSDYNDGTFILGAPYDKGRTMTHEVGHWLGLKHIWGDGDCSVDDFCADTPNAATANYNCPTNLDSCPDPGLDMVQNYMDYTDDPCMNIFTADQKARMITVMNNSTRRSTLKTSTKDLPIPLFANDAEIKIEKTCSTGALCGSTAQPVQKITLTNRGTSNLTSASLTYSVSGGPSATYSWTGNLATDKFATFDMPVTATASGSITINIASTNGTADQRTSNNSATGTFNLPVPQNFNYTQVAFSLQRDYYGSETTWTLKNAAGTTLYSGGPYTNTPTALPVVFTQEWSLPANGCYTFQINDTAGDGICCSYGNGFYNVKSLDGTVTLISGGSFGTAESKSFTNNVLGTGEFENSLAIYIYPNPSKSNLNIAVPAELGLPDSYIIHNYLGQKVGEKKITFENDLSINTSDLSSGVYMITISKNSLKKTMRFIKE
ncbi:MAG TPA: M43 family zinc metalloprotease, partial [Flavobacterium sp.]|nr:M43 family zinc metalloprotease [Flavobacterium sp.]